MAEIDQEGDDDLLFAEEEEEGGDASGGTAAPAMGEPWAVLIVDDDPEVHAITRVVLSDVIYDNRPLRFLSAYTAKEAKSVLCAHADIAAILLDVVMETDDAGLQLVRFIRDEMDNKQVRIILRTGQPGQAPERQVIVSYDINDYKAKSELTAQKLFTATVAALRSYQHISRVEQSRNGLEKIVAASACLFEQRSMPRFVEGVVQQFGALVRQARGSLLCSACDGTAPDAIAVVAGTGLFETAQGRSLTSCVPAEVLDDIMLAVHERRNIYRDQHAVMVFRSRNHAAGTACRALYLLGQEPLSDIERQLMEIFCSKAAIGFDNVHLYEQLANAQKATVYALGKLAEFKDEVTGEHVKRIERMSTLIARELQQRGVHGHVVDDTFCELIGMASILHDVGKVGIPDSVLRKPGKLDDAEMRIMREHAAMGGSILREASRLVAGPNYLALAAEIAESHHEKFDGSGYPRSLSGQDIPLAGRIVAVADVFDALMHKRPYKEAWERQTTIDFIRAEAGRHFDPAVVDAFMTVLARDESLLPPLQDVAS